MLLAYTPQTKYFGHVGAKPDLTLALTVCWSTSHPSRREEQQKGDLPHTCWQQSVRCRDKPTQLHPALHTVTQRKQTGRGIPQNFQELLQAMLPYFSSWLLFSECFSESSSCRAGPLLCYNTKAGSSLPFVIKKKKRGRQIKSPSVFGVIRGKMLLRQQCGRLGKVAAFCEP